MSVVQVKPNTGSTALTLGAFALVGYLVYRKTQEAVEDVTDGVTNVINTYKTDIIESYSNIKDTAVSFVPFLGGDDNASPQEQAFRDMPKSELDTEWLNYTGYNATGYTDVSKIGMSPYLAQDAAGINSEINAILNKSAAGTSSSGSSSKLPTYKAVLKDGSNANIVVGVSVDKFQAAVDRVDSMKATLKANRSASGTQYDTKIKRAFS